MCGGGVALEESREGRRGAMLTTTSGSAGWLKHSKLAQLVHRPVISASANPSWHLGLPRDLLPASVRHRRLVANAGCWCGSSVASRDAVGITLQLEDVDRDLAGSLAQLQGAHEAVRASVENARAKVRRVIEGIRNAEKEAAEASGRPAFDEGDPTEARSLKERLYDLETLNPDTWQELGTGYFGTVYRAFVQGTEVAIKVLTEDKEQAILKEYCQLRELRHDNIVAIRDLGQLKEGCIPRLGLLKPFRFLMMEHVGVNLATYVARQEERSPRLPRSRTWDIMRQVVSALNYLHTLADPIAHCDLKPDNILIDEHVLDLRVKLVDFGISRKRGNLSELQEFTRWSAPELVGKDIASDADPMMPYIKGDIWTVGLLIYFMQTGLEPYGSRTDNAVKEEAIEVAQALYQALLQSPELPDDVLLQIQMQCLQPEGKPRPTARQLLDTFFKDGRNPYLSEEKKADFFTFGFLRDTKIFVADSVIGNVVEGENGHRPTLGYRPRYLSCVIDKKKLEGPTLEYDAAAYWKRRREYGKMVKENKIFDGQTYALVGLTTSRCGAMETHVISLRLKETMYVHHRVMREMWMTLEEREKLKQVSCKMQVHPFYSTSLGVHIAVLTNEGGGKKKFIFTRRSNRTGIATPSMWTCGAVETLSVNDVETKVKGRKKKEIRMVRLLRTAARGLEEELNIVLTSEELHAINLHTVYLKFDTHEWGVCGFVDLSDSRIQRQHRLSFAQVRAGFTSGAKDKFEHEEVVGVDFDLDSMVTFVRQHAAFFASSTKLVVVKTLQAHFPIARLLCEFDAGEDEALALRQ